MICVHAALSVLFKLLLFQNCKVNLQKCKEYTAYYVENFLKAYVADFFIHCGICFLPDWRGGFFVAIFDSNHASVDFSSAGFQGIEIQASTFCSLGCKHFNRFALFWNFNDRF